MPRPRQPKPKPEPITIGGFTTQELAILFRAVNKEPQTEPTRLLRYRIETEFRARLASEEATRR